VDPRTGRRRSEQPCGVDRGLPRGDQRSVLHGVVARAVVGRAVARAGRRLVGDAGQRRRRRASVRRTARAPPARTVRSSRCGCRGERTASACAIGRPAGRRDCGSGGATIVLLAGSLALQRRKSEASGRPR
jgi:hypothetical protein